MDITQKWKLYEECVACNPDEKSGMSGVLLDSRVMFCFYGTGVHHSISGLNRECSMLLSELCYMG